MSEAPPGTPDPSDEIIRDLKRKVAELEAKVEHLDRELNVSQMQESIGIERFQAAEAREARLSEALRQVRHAIMNADPAVLTDTFWMPDNVFKGGTVVDFIDAALSGSGSGWRGSYRLLETTDTIQAGDEVIGDDGVTWCPVDRWSIGCGVSRLFKSIRRALPAAPQQGGE